MSPKTERRLRKTIKHLTRQQLVAWIQDQTNFDYIGSWCGEPNKTFDHHSDQQLRDIALEIIKLSGNRCHQTDRPSGNVATPSDPGEHPCPPGLPG